MADSVALGADKMVLSVKDIKDYLGIGINQAYALAKSNQFKVVHSGKRIIIPRKAFEDWLNS